MSADPTKGAEGETKMRPASFLLLAMLTGCSSVAEPGVFSVAPALDEPFTLAVGQAARIDGAGLTLRFVSVPSDSRCPSNVQCVWAGDAAVAIELTLRRGNVAPDTLHTLLDPRSRDLGIGTLRLLGLDPYPEDVTPIPTGEYRATFIIE